MTQNPGSFKEENKRVDALLNVPVPDSIRMRLQSGIDSFSTRADLSRPNTVLRLTLAFSAIALIVAVTTLWQRSRTIPGNEVFAAVIKAMEGVDTVHITGWTTEIEQRFLPDKDDQARHALNTWEWMTDEGVRRRYSEQGPIVIVVDEDRRYEYDSEYDRLFVRERHNGDTRAHSLRGFSDQIKALDDPRVKLRELGNRTIIEDSEKQSHAVGYAWREAGGGEGECWIDAETGLPIVIDEYRTSLLGKRQTRHGEVQFDVPVPEEILAYTVPDAKEVYYDWRIDPRFELWNRHLEAMAERLANEPLPEAMALYERASDEKMQAYAPGRLEGITEGTGFWLYPLQQSLESFLEQEWTPKGTIKLADELMNMELNYDLLTRNEHSVNDRIRFIIDALGLHLVERMTDEMVWVAQYDGRTLKPWESVKAPVPDPDNVPNRPGMRSTWGSEFSLGFLIDQLSAGTNVIIVDETGIRSTAVASESPTWLDSEASDAIAKRWFEEEFGVTFTEEMRQQRMFEVSRP